MNTNLTALEAFALYILVTSAIGHIHVITRAMRKKPRATPTNLPEPANSSCVAGNCAETNKKDQPVAIKKPSIIEPVDDTIKYVKAPASLVKAKDRTVKVNEQAAEYYLMQRMIDRGMHNLTTKYHRSKKPVT